MSDHIEDQVMMKPFDALTSAEIVALAGETVRLREQVAALEAESEEYAQLQSRCFEGYSSCSDGIFDYVQQQAEQIASLENSLAEYQQDTHTTADALGHVQRQLEEVSADRDEWIACHAKIFRELQETKTLVGNKCAEVAALAEQNEKMRKALKLVPPLVDGNWLISHVEQIDQALALPDIATPALNRIKREGMLDAAEICKQIEAEKWQDFADKKLAVKTYGAVRCANEIYERADELYPEVKL